MKAHTQVKSRSATGLGLSPVVLHRVGGLPIDVVLDLADADLVSRVEALTEARRELALHAAAIADRIALAIGGEEDRTLRQALIRVRRAVFGGRSLSPGDLATIAGNAAGEEPLEYTDLLRWDRARIAFDKELARADTEAELSAAAARDRLAVIASDEKFLDGLAIASSPLRRDAALYATGWRELAEKRRRSIERTLLSYLYRSACKTSPFSTFTTVTMGSLAGRGPEHEVEREDVRSSTLALHVLADVAAGILEDRARLADLRVTLSSGLVSVDGQLRFVRRFEQSPGSRNSDESVFYLRAGHWLDQIVQIISESSSPPTVDEVVRRLCSASVDVTPEDAQTFIVHLIDLSLVNVPALRIDLSRGDFAAAFAAQLRALGPEWAEGLAEQIEVLDEIARSFASQSGQERISARKNAERAAVELLRSVGKTIRPDENVVYEDVVSGRVVRLPLSAMENLGVSLDSLAKVLPLFDLLSPHRVVLRGYFFRRWSEEHEHQDVLGFVHEFYQDVYTEFSRSILRWDEFDEQGRYVAPPNLMKLPDLDRFSAARRTLIDEMRVRYERHPSSDETLVLDDEFFDVVAAQLPPLDRSIDARSHFIQLAQAGDDSVGVLNQSYSGLTLMFSRFLNAFDGVVPEELTQALRDELVTRTPEGAVLAELRGSPESTNLNLHPSVLDFELVCPGDASGRAADAQIAVSSLVLRAREDGDIELYSPALGKRVIPVYLGFLVPMALPQIQRVLLLFSPATMLGINFWQGVEEALGEREMSDHPRLQVGSLVVVRRTWRTRPELLPRREQERREIDWLLNWSDWHRRSGLPRFVFVSCDSVGARPSKPQFVDFLSPLSLRVLEHLTLRAHSRVVFSEMLPGPDELLLSGTMGSHVSEHVVEMVRTPEEGR